MQARTREQTRQAYLDAMGIQTWFPRRPVPNAKPPRTFDWLEHPLPKSGAAEPAGTSAIPEAPALPSQPVPDAVPKRQNLTAAKILGQVQLDNRPDQPLPTSGKNTRLTVGKGRPAQLSSKFRLVIIPVNQDNLVVAEMPYTGMSQFTRFHHRLLKDLLKALGMTLPVHNTAQEFTWPLQTRLPHQGLLGQIHQDDGTAADAVKAFLNNQFGLNRQHTVLLLGQAAARFVIDPNRSFEELKGFHEQQPGQPKMIVSHSLNELMKIPGLKPETWQDLKLAIDHP
ncbi:hypothetical protein [Endozoicomonas sp. Mp262]|uniref:hypothetical protein n=1 Tax=Endozoicomonas sp. Mp262 TaxID=2919499 RepID=UPI0021E0EB60